MTNAQTLTERAANLLQHVQILRESFGLSAAVYTQTADVETECNGLLTYDRAIAKLDPVTLATANWNSRERKSRVIVPNALYAHVTWKYTVNPPGADWTKPGYDDSEWQSGMGGFGTEGTPGSVINTTWDTNDIWLRREFVLDAPDLRGARIQFHHDEDAEVYLNGVLATRAPGYITGYEEVAPEAAALATLITGTNTMAVHCHQTKGGQYIDVGIIAPDIQTNASAGK